MKSAYRERQEITITNLADMLNHDIGMLTTVIIGNSSTFLYDNKIITPRGYQKKYTLNMEKQPLKPHQRLQKRSRTMGFRSRNKDSYGEVSSWVAYERT